MTHSELYSELCKQFDEHRVEYDWLDEEIDGILQLAHIIIFSAPRDDFFSDFTPSIICDDFNSDFVCEAVLYIKINDTEYFIELYYDGYSISYDDKKNFEVIYTSDMLEYPTEKDSDMIYHFFTPLLQK